MKLKTRAAAAWTWVATGLLAGGFAGAASAQSIEELREMSISALANLDVTSVTKSAGSLGSAPASIYVITHDDIVRSGTLTLVGILRLAPNLQVMRGGGDNGTVITARGLSGNTSYQNFSNKLLVLIDGRTVYSPLYSGVYWDMQDVLPEDIDRIEVISGPGATLWGANAVNGVINIITRNAGTTQSLYGTGIIGNRNYDLGLRYGGRAGDSLNYRLFLKRHQNFVTSSGAGDASRRTQGGFRVDWSPSASDVIMMQGDGYVGVARNGAAPDEVISGYDLLARWNRTLSGGSALQAQAYYDHAGRDVGDGRNGSFAVDTFDGEIQHSFSVADHSIVWGGGARAIRYTIENIPNLLFVPPQRTLFLANLFAQDSVAITPSLTGIVGLKLEDGAYTGIEVLPSARLSWKPRPSTLLWAAVSRAIRSPTPFDRDVQELDGTGKIALDAGQTFRPEKLTAYEMGTRLVLSGKDTFSVSVSGFYNDYDDLRSIEPKPVTVVPYGWGNGIQGHSYGFDAWADIRPFDWWRLKPAYSFLVEKFRFKPDASAFLSVAQVGNDPRHRASLRSSMDLGPVINFDADLRYVSALPSPFSPSYVELGARLGWRFVEQAELSISGFNLLHDKHQELPLSQAAPLGRSVYVALKWTI